MFTTERFFKKNLVGVAAGRDIGPDDDRRGAAIHGGAGDPDHYHYDAVVHQLCLPQ